MAAASQPRTRRTSANGLGMDAPHRCSILLLPRRSA
jgi:hypothetical protein